MLEHINEALLHASLLILLNNRKGTARERFQQYVTRIFKEKKGKTWQNKDLFLVPDKYGFDMVYQA